MTTSLLLNHTRNGLNDHDLQSIRDFALEAPWNWRVALEELVETAFKLDTALEEADDAKSKQEIVEEEFEDLTNKLARTAKKMLRYVEKLETARKNKNLTNGDVESISAGIRTALDELNEQIKTAASRFPSSPG